MEELSFEEFRDRIQKKSGSVKHHKVSGSIGVYDIYKALRRNKWKGVGKPLKEHEFYSIIRTVGNLIAEQVRLGKSVSFPAQMGGLELRKYSATPYMKDGKLKVTYPIDWDKTLRLWYEDEEARKAKTLIRIENPETYRIKYAKRSAAYNNKIFYDFVVNRFIKRALKVNIVAGIADTIYKEY